MTIPIGLAYIPNVISEDDESDILSFLNDEQGWTTVGNGKNSRQVLHYGYYYDYKSGKVDIPAPPIPFILTTLLPIGFHPDQCIVNKYLPGQGISAHIDSLKYDEFIYCITLGVGATMTFRHGSDLIYNLYTEPRSAYSMSGDARYKWKHEMRARLSDQVAGETRLRGVRYSITFRNLDSSI
jgi:alkylated DNA repair dioxygenase AlkB